MGIQQQDNEFSIAKLAFQETLDLLEWPRLTEQLSTFASTVAGRRECVKYSIPNNFSISQRLLSETTEIGELDIEIEGGLSFLGVKDIKHIVSRCSKGGVVSGEELLEVAETLRASRRLRRQGNYPQKLPIISDLFSNLVALPDLQRLIEFGLEEGGRVADRASRKLAELRRKKNVLKMQRRDSLKDLISRYNSLLQDHVIAERSNRPVLVLKAGAVDKIAGIIHDTSASGNTVFLEPKSVISLGNNIASLEAKIILEENNLLAHWSSEVGVNVLAINKLCQVLVQLDFALARARFGKWLGGVVPKITENSDAPIEIKEFRHPLLVWQEHFQQGDVVVPISFEVSRDLRVVAITGPNTGGKTVTLKSIGLSILMAKFGLLLPCTGEPSLPWFNQILADIGDEQSLEQNLSTFSGHIIRIRRILDSIAVNPGPSIVLLDELGAGTDPSEGTALAIALLKTLADRARLTVATTHFGELKALKYEDSRFENASVGFNTDTMSPTYHLQWGIPGKSNALAIAKRLGLDDAVTDIAQNFINVNGEENVNNVIEGLNLQRQRQQKAAEDAATLLARTELLHEELIDRWQKQHHLSEQFQEKGRMKLEKSIREGQKEVRELIRRLRDGSADGELARKTGQRLRRIENTNRKDKSNKERKSWVPKLGDRVRLLSLGKAGEIVWISDDGLQLTIMCGLFRSTVDLDSVESIDGHKPSNIDPVIKIKTSAPITSNSSLRTKRNTIDVRGLRVHEAEVVVDEKIRNSLGPVWVIHGIGTGRLKKGLIEWLETLDYVERITTAEEFDGGAGCSVIWIK